MSGYRSGAPLGPRLVTKPDTPSVTALGSALCTTDQFTVDTYASWVQVVASTSAESYITRLVISLPASGNGPPTATDGPTTVQLAIGGSGSEVVKFESVAPLTVFTTRTAILVPIDPYLRVTAGKRLAVRFKLAATVNQRDLTFTVYGLPISQTEGF